MSIDVWTGYAVLVVSRSGERRVIVGPHTHLLEYDETLQPLDLSTGTPKSDDTLMRTAYLRVLHNKVSDLVEAETRDLVAVHLRLSYRVNFEGDSARWFNVENYVKFLTDHLRSLIRHAVKQHGIEHFYGRAASIIRDAVLGQPGAGEEHKRPGRAFVENGMRVYDVEVLDVTIGDESIAQLLVGEQQEAVRQALAIAGEQRKVSYTREREATRQAVLELEADTKLKKLGLKRREVDETLAVDLGMQAAEARLRKEKQTAASEEQAAIDRIHEAELGRKRSAAELERELGERLLEQALRKLDAEVRAVAGKAAAISPELIAALQAFSDRALTERVAESMAPLAILGGDSVADVLGRLLQGTPLANALLSAAGGADGGKPQPGGKKS